MLFPKLFVLVFYIILEQSVIIIKMNIKFTLIQTNFGLVELLSIIILYYNPTKERIDLRLESFEENYLFEF